MSDIDINEAQVSNDNLSPADVALLKKSVSLRV